MKIKVFAALLCLAFPAAAFAEKHHDYQKGDITRMESVSCGTQEKGSKTFAGELLGTDGQHKNTQQVLCQEYILQTDRVVYRIRPKEEKHPALLPIGESAQFRIHKDVLILRIPETDGKEREYTVVSMTPREVAPVPTAAKN